MSAHNVTVEPVPADMGRYEWKTDSYSRAKRSWCCWNCGEEVMVEVSRGITKAEVVKR